MPYYSFEKGRGFDRILWWVNILQLYVLCTDSGVCQILNKFIERKFVYVNLFSEKNRFIDSIGCKKSGVVLIDFDIDHICGIDIIRQLRHRNILLPIICVSKSYKICEMGESLRLVSCQFIIKSQLSSELSTIVKSCIEQTQSESIETNFVNSSIKSRFSKLTPRELEVLSGLISGERSKAIAFRLNVSCRTVELHRANIMSKLEIGSITELIKLLLLSDTNDIYSFCKSYLQLNNHYSM